jgi:rhamnulokinase
MIALAIDLGASSGRAVAGQFDGQQLEVREISRFANNPVRVSGRLHWDILHLFHELKQGMRAACHAGLGEVESIAIDAWGLDFGLVDRRGELVGNPYHYRDEHTNGVMEDVLEIVPREEIFARTGIQFMSINSLYQLFAMQRSDASALDRAAALLMIPDLLRFFLTGQQSSEYTDASTTQFLSLATGDWDRPLLDRLGLPTALLTPIVPPATPAGHLLRDVAEEVGCGPIPIVAVASHDTASAVMAVPASGEFAYLSCGTWSLLGTELKRPILSEQALSWNFTNEGGVAGTYRLLKNIMGLWLIEGCRRSWERDGTWCGYEVIESAAEAAPGFLSLVDPDAPQFLNPLDMPRAVADFCRESNQPIPDTPGSMTRCILESLALKYRLVLERTERLTCRRFPGIHVVGGGTRNTTLMQFTANAIGRPVWSGPAEATAIGNVLGQLMAQGRITSINEGRALVGDSYPFAVFEPRATGAWDDAFERFLRITSGRSRDFGVAEAPDLDA